MHLGVVKLGDRRGRHDVAAIDQDRVVIGGGNIAIVRQVFKQVHMHQAVFLQGVQLAGFKLARLQALHRLWHRHLVDQYLAFAQGGLRNAVAGLDDAGGQGVCAYLHAGGTLKKPPDVDRIDGVVRALVYHFEHVLGPDHRGRHLDATRAPTVGQWHFARAKGHLVARNSHRFENGAADHALGALVQVGKIDMWVAHRAQGLGLDFSRLHR